MDQLVDPSLFGDLDPMSKDVKVFKKKTSRMPEEYLEGKYGDRVVEAEDIRGKEENIILVAFPTAALTVGIGLRVTARRAGFPSGAAWSFPGHRTRRGPGEDAPASCAGR